MKGLVWDSRHTGMSWMMQVEPIIGAGNQLWPDKCGANTVLGGTC